MEGKHAVWLAFIVALTIVSLMLISVRNKPVLTDPFAQRIWAATHGNVDCNYQEAIQLIKETTKTVNCDSTAKDSKK